MSEAKKEISIGLVIALQEELDAFNNYIAADERCSVLEDGSVHINGGLIGFNIFIQCVNKMGAVDHILPVNRFIQKNNFSSDYIFNLGIAGKISNDIDLGDVVLAEQIYYEQNGKIIDNKYLRSLDTYNNSDVPKFKKYCNNDRIISDFENHAPDTLKRPRKISINTGKILSTRDVCASIEANNNIKEIDRKILAIEMESYGVALACIDNHKKLIAIKGISDRASFNKSETDDISIETDNGEVGFYRQWAMKNATHVFVELIINNASSFIGCINDSNLGKETLESGSNVEILNHFALFLSKRYANAQVSNSDVVKYDAFFSKALHSEYPQDHSLQKLGDDISNGMNLILKAEKGCGKSTFLAILYHLLAKKQNNTVVYINFRRFYSQFSKDKSSLTFNKAKESLDTYLRNIKTQTVIFMLDDVDSLERADKTSIFSEYAENIINMIQNTPQKVLVFGVRKDYPAEKCMASCDDVYLNREIHLLPFSNLNHDACEIAKAYIDISVEDAAKIDEREFYKTVTMSSLKNYNIFILYLLRNNIKKTNINITSLIEEYCKTQICRNSKDYTLDHAASEIFSHYVHGEKLSKELLYNFNCNTITRDFLVAYEYYNNLKKYSKGEKLDNICYIFNESINSHIKKLFFMDANKPNFYKFKDIIFCILEEIQTLSDGDVMECHFRGLAQCIYLFCRFDYEKSMVCKELRSIQATIKGLVSELANRERGLVLRSIYIGLARAGDAEALNEYTKILLESEVENDINRGFYLEYYGDQNSDIKRSMSHKDALGSCARTFHHLSSLIEAQITSKKKSLTFEIELFTLLSIFHSRVSNYSNFNDSDQLILMKQKIENIISKFNSSNIKRIQKRILNYINFINDVVIKDGYNSLDAIIDLYKTKFIERTGWINRKINNIRRESIAEHTFGACLLALIFLPKKWEEKNEVIYRDEIVNMLLIHDLAEAYTGDIVNKNEQDRIKEARWMSNISCMGISSFLADLTSFESLFSKINNCMTIAGKVAHDIDKIDCFIQLHFYKSKITEDEFRSFYDALWAEVDTEIGRKILEQVGQYLEDREILNIDIAKYKLPITTSI